MEIKDLYNDSVYNECIERINKLSTDSKPQWGKMDVAKMLAHCSEVQEVMNGKELKNTPWFIKVFLKGIIRKAVVNDTPYKKNNPTHPQYLVKSDKNFDTEKQRLLQSLETFKAEDKKAAANRKHLLFGTMTELERGWSNYKHLDYHLNQFGV